jgi:predicted ATP-grasp superfamily ATP-dependent carboligase
MLKVNNPTLVATNILHYAYYLQNKRSNVTVIGSLNSPLAIYKSEFSFEQPVILYDTENSLESLINADIVTNGNNSAYITWKPVSTDATVLGNQYDTVHKLECKATFRKLLPKSLFPNYVIKTNIEFANCDYDTVSKELKTDKFVLQIDYSTGGKGTFVVDTAIAFEAVKDKLVTAKQDIVISTFIEGESRGLQCYFDSTKIVSTKWWHKDLVGINGVCNLDVDSATRYCGAIIENIPEEYHEQVQDIYSSIQSMLVDVGYFGIFGLDIVVAGGKIYVIEINPRFTAVSHLYSTVLHSLNMGTDFLTLHVDSLVNGVPNIITDDVFLNVKLDKSFYYLKVQNLMTTNATLAEECKIGVYDNNASYVRFGFGVQQLQKDNEVVVIPEVSSRSVCSPGDRMFSIIGTSDNAINGKVLSDDISNIIANLSNKFTVETK